MEIELRVLWEKKRRLGQTRRIAIAAVA